MKLTFLGGIETVTGSRTLLEYAGKNILVDAGLFQGEKKDRELNWWPHLPIKKIDAVIITHAHLDHSGLLPKLYQDGLRAPIYCSQGTLDLCKILLLDAAHLQLEDAKFANKTGYSHHQPALPLYTIEDVEGVLALFTPLPIHEWIEIFAGLQVRFKRAGHIIGSNIVEISYAKKEKIKTICFSGDVGNGRSSIILPPEPLTQTNYLVLESTYGDKLQPRIDAKIAISEFINRVTGRGGMVLIPAFAIGRSQEVLQILADAREEGLISRNIPIYLDSPMAKVATEVFLSHHEEHLRSPTFQNFVEMSESHEQSKKLNSVDTPMVLISASGMLTGGRIMHHLKIRLPDPKNGLLFVGFQAPNTKGRVLQSGSKDLRIHHQPIEVNAEIHSIENLSAHADYEDLITWLAHLKEKPEKIFLNHGDPEARSEFCKKLQDLKYEVYLAKKNESITL